ncbi:MAG: 3-deoxy-7-phosphoheptulonate synthase, partial [Anaerolineae bacterium]|nr:3-deoxy-7-phosphoheptulonate synthase [Anaerolineae bacterium]
EFGVKIMRGMAFKPRTSPYEFQGLGEAGLKIARQVANKYGMSITSEIMDMSQLAMMSDYVDIFWVGARNMQNSFLLKALGKVRQPVILKRGFGNNIKEWLNAAEYIISAGNPNVIFMERGIRTDGLMVEVHPNPPVAMSDAKQQLYFDQFRAVMRALQAMEMPQPFHATGD